MGRQTDRNRNRDIHTSSQTDRQRQKAKYKDGEMMQNEIAGAKWKRKKRSKETILREIDMD